MVKRQRAGSDESKPHKDHTIHAVPSVALLHTHPPASRADLRLLLGDSRELIKQIPDKSIDLICIDPPYNLRKYSTGNLHTNWHKPFNNDIAEWEGIGFHPAEWLAEFVRILKPTGNLFAFTLYNKIGEWHAAYDPIFDTFHKVVWYITDPSPKARREGFYNACQDIVCCWNKGHTWNFIGRGPGQGYLMHNLIKSGHCGGNERLKDENGNTLHPTQKPEYVTDWIIERASNPGDLVLDCFMGVGSTGASALKLGRRFIGIEIDERYYRAACSRLGVQDV